VGRRVKLRRTPQIIFHWDPAPEKGEQVEQLLDQLRAQSQASAAPEVAPDSEHDDD
jgi:ribosome-binding factor A